MCGIVGVAGKLNNKTDKALKTLLVLDAVRGIDSTGIAAVHRDGEVKVVKQLGNPYELFDTRGFAPAINKMNRVVIGHNRFATQGEVNRKNAHPFEFDTLVGVHNGTLRNKWKLLDANLFKVDSENLYYHIEHEGLDSFLEIVDGAYALVWWDKVNEELNFLRNKERPMWCVKSIDGEVLFWASERWMIEIAAGREDIKLGEFHPMMEDMHYRIPINKDGVMEKPIVSLAQAKFVPPPVFQQQQKWSAHGGADSKKATSTKTLTLVPTTAATEKKSDIQSSTASKRGYVNSKGLAIELMALCVDSQGATYISCYDANEPLVKLRMYYNKKDDEITKRLGDVVLADIKDIQIHRTEGTFYKVARNSVKEVPKVVLDIAAITKAIVAGTLDEEDEASDEVLVKDHRGNMISEEQFAVTYGTCASCTGFVDPAKKHRFCTNGEAVCDVCLSDPETAKYLPLV